MYCKMCNADKSMTVVWLSTEARNPCNTNCLWPPMILPTTGHYIIPLDAVREMSLSVTSQHKL